MTRIIGGTAGGRRLETPRGDATRPTSDRVREALFSAVEAWAGTFAGLHVLDLYAGSGAVGLEAWSRGAARVTLVESDRRTAELIGRNAATLGAPVAVVAGSVGVHLGGDAGTPVDLAFLDPPYPLDEATLADDLLLLTRHLADDALVVVERSARSPEPTWPAGLARWRHKRYGETALWYARAAGAVG